MRFDLDAKMARRAEIAAAGKFARVVLDRPPNREIWQMADDFDTCLAFTLKEEGGYSDDPADPGGATNMGITLATYRQWSDNPSLGALQVQDLSERTARAIYRSLYWNPLRADALPAGVDLSVFDMGSTPGYGIGAAPQRALGFTEGGRRLASVRRPWQRREMRSADPRQRPWPNGRRRIRSLSDFRFSEGWLNRTCGVGGRARNDRGRNTQSV
jgi:hypothetical protein